MVWQIRIALSGKCCNMLFCCCCCCCWICCCCRCNCHPLPLLLLPLQLQLRLPLPLLLLWLLLWLLWLLYCCCCCCCLMLLLLVAACCCVLLLVVLLVVACCCLLLLVAAGCLLPVGVVGVVVVAGVAVAVAVAAAVDTPYLSKREVNSSSTVLSFVTVPYTSLPQFISKQSVWELDVISSVRRVVSFELFQDLAASGSSEECILRKLDNARVRFSCWRLSR